MRRFHLVTLGCQMNKHDSERIAGLLQAEGFEPTSSESQADVIIFNTCSVREHAEERLFARVNSLKPLKREKPGLIIAVGGCVGQKEGPRLLARCPDVDLVFGTHNLSNLPNLIREVKAAHSSLCQTWEKPQVLSTDLPSLRESPFKAWVTITLGCNNFCSYCIVPYVRGRKISRPLLEIVTEVKELVDEGVLEVTLLGQNVNSYGRNGEGRGEFAALIKRLESIEGLERVRFTTSHPKDLTEDIIEAVSEGDKICEHFHLPFQAGSDRVLKLMNRDYSKAHYLNLVKKIREKVLAASITTDIMVGFPGETEEDFRETLDIVEQVRFDQAFTFIFSSRPGTPAAKMENQVPNETKLKRFQRLVDLQKKISLRINRAWVGEKVEVLVEGESKKKLKVAPSRAVAKVAMARRRPKRLWRVDDKSQKLKVKGQGSGSGDSLFWLKGRTRGNKVVNFQGSKSLIGKLIQVTIEKAHPHSLTGKLVGEDVKSQFPNPPSSVRLRRTAEDGQIPMKPQCQMSTGGVRPFKSESLC